MLRTVKSNPNSPSRLLVYGPEKVGKSTLGARAGKSVFIAPEGGCDQLKTARGEPVEMMPNISTWDSVVQAVQRLTAEPHDFETVVLDSVDWIENLCHRKIIGSSGRSITTCNGGYGAGLNESKKLHSDLIYYLSVLREKRKMDILLIGHTHVKEVKDPEMVEKYDSFKIKCDERVADLWKEWADAIIFVRQKTFVKAGEDSKKGRAFSDGSNVMYAKSTPSFEAGNRYGMPAEMPFDFSAWETLKSYTVTKTTEDLRREIMKLVPSVPEEVKKQLLDYMQRNVNDLNALKNLKNRTLQIIEEQKQLTQGDANVTN